MSSLPQRQCAQAGCPVLVTSGRCIVHAMEREVVRGKTAARGYGGDWRRVRKVQLATHPLCQINTHCIHPTLATEVDHKVPISDRPDLRLDLANLQSACKACNSAKRERKQAQAVQGEPSRFRIETPGLQTSAIAG